MQDSESDESEVNDEYTNQYSLIYPSYRNTEAEYNKYFLHSQKCYE